MIYECHITIEPVFESKLLTVKAIASEYDFKVAELLMKKGHDMETSRYDTFMTGHSKNYEELVEDMRCLIEDLKTEDIKVWRYKIEDIVLDSRYEDTYKLLDLT
jgi:hypothetical protein